MSNNDKTTIGVVIMLLLLLVFGWRFIAPAFAGMGGGSDVEPFVPTLQMPTIISPIINIDFGTPGDYKPIIDPGKPLPTCGCIGNGDIGADWKTLPVFQSLAPVIQRYEPVKSGVSIPLLGAPVRRNLEIVPSKGGGGDIFYAIYEAMNWQPATGQWSQPKYSRGKLLWSGVVPRELLPFPGVLDIPNMMTMQGNTHTGSIPTSTRSFLARSGMLGQGQAIIYMAPTGNYN